MKINPTKLKQRRPFLTVLVILLVLSVAVITYVYFYTNNNSGFAADGINYSPATEQDKALNDRHKQELVEQLEKDSNSDEEVTENNQSKQSVTPVITAWGQPDGPGEDFKLNGYVPKIIETDGACTLILRKDGKSVTVSKGALQNAQNTSCGRLSVAYDKLTPGKWQATLSYSSSASAGSSNVTPVEVK